MLRTLLWCAVLDTVSFFLYVLWTADSAGVWFAHRVACDLGKKISDSIHKRASTGVRKHSRVTLEGSAPNDSHTHLSHRLRKGHKVQGGYQVPPCDTDRKETHPATACGIYACDQVDLGAGRQSPGESPGPPTSGNPAQGWAYQFDWSQWRVSPLSISWMSCSIKEEPLVSSRVEHLSR